jgi:hypothetical protein
VFTAEFSTIVIQLMWVYNLKPRQSCSKKESTFDLTAVLIRTWLVVLFSEWHQFDGIVNKEPENRSAWSVFKSGLSKFVGSYHRQITERTKMAAKAMLPSWFDLVSSQLKGQSAERLLERLDQVCYCVGNCFVTEDINQDFTKIKEVLHAKSSQAGLKSFIFLGWLGWLH